MWLTDPLMPDIKTIADFRKDNGLAIRSACKQFLVLCRRLNLFTEAAVAIDGCKFQVQLEANILRDPYQPSLRSSGTDRER
jgi:transposase